MDDPQKPDSGSLNPATLDHPASGTTAHDLEGTRVGVIFAEGTCEGNPDRFGYSEIRSPVFRGPSLVLFFLK